MSPKTYIILSPPYDENNGGAISLHKLCQHLNELGRTAYLFPYFPMARFDTEDTVEFQRCMEFTEQYTSHFSINPEIKCDVVGVSNLKQLAERSDIVIVYPEIISGNPLGGKNVVRWLMHDAGFFTKKVYFCPGEIYFRYGPDTKKVQIPGSHLSDNFLTTIHIPFDTYNSINASPERVGTAYCIRKSREKSLQHELNGSTLIDGKIHAEIASIFRSVKQFISYDSRTFYSRLAVLCGCDSIVIPDPGVSEEEWMPDPEARYGVAYGFENLEKARQSAPDTIRFLQKMEENSIKTTRSFIAEVEAYFASR
jgi:hypothetical protein